MGISLELSPKGGFEMIATMTALFILGALMVGSLIISSGGAGITWL
jgi:hypothetical protein